MASDKMLGSFDQKSAPEDNDLLVEYDASASKVKNVKFGGVWNWIVKKLTSAVINELQTSSKNVVGAINELNSNLTYHNITLQNKDLQEYALSLTDSVEIVSFDKTTTNAPCDYGWAIIFRKYQDSKIIAFSKIENNIYSCTKGALYDGWGSWRLI